MNPYKPSGLPAPNRPDYPQWAVMFASVTVIVLLIAYAVASVVVTPSGRTPGAVPMEAAVKK